jgi:hypothetical protein
LPNEKVFGSAEASRDIDGVRRSEHPHQATFHVMALKAEAGGGADEARALDWTIEFQLSKVQEEALAVAKAAAATETSDT